MDVQKTADTEITIHGDIVKDADYRKVHEEIGDVLSSNESLKLNLKDCHMLSSALMGQLLKYAQRDHKKIEICYESDNIYDVLDRLDLKDFFTLTKI